MSSHNHLLALLALPYNKTRDLEPYFAALKDFCRECPAHPEKRRLHAAVCALYDVRYEKAPYPGRAEANYYPYNALPQSFWEQK